MSFAKNPEVPGILQPITSILQNPLPSLIYKHLKDKEPGLCCYCLISSVENVVNLTPRFIVNYQYQSI